MDTFLQPNNDTPPFLSQALFPVNPHQQKAHTPLAQVDVGGITRIKGRESESVRNREFKKHVAGKQRRHHTLELTLTAIRPET